MNKQVTEALTKIQTLRRFDPNSKLTHLAVTRVLNSLSIPDYTDVVLELSKDDAPAENGGAQ